jgi:KamA family protein
VREDQTSRYRALGPAQLDGIVDRYGLSREQRDVVALHSQVLPFRTNEYVLEQLVDWSAVPEDPIFQLVFPQPGMLAPEHEQQLRRLPASAGPGQRAAAVGSIRAAMNPHPAGQRELNVPRADDEPLEGVQHKYARTVLYFPAAGQTCHAYCTYCFRWAQFVGDAEMRFAASSPQPLVEYLRSRPEVTDVLVTGGDPMIMSTARLRAHVEPLLAVPSLRTIRFGTKALAYWPQRFTTDPDAGDLLALFEQIVASGRTVAVMAHVSHARELSTDLASRAVAAIRATGAAIYCQAPIMRRINDSAQAWLDMWQRQLAMGAVPYYMFMARDTGPRGYFEVPIARAVEVFAAAYRELPGLARTVRGPVMSTTPGKLAVDGMLEEAGRRVLSVRFLQARQQDLVGRPFHVMAPPGASWADQLHPVPGTPADLVAALATVGEHALEGDGAA